MWLRAEQKKKPSPQTTLTQGGLSNVACSKVAELYFDPGLLEQRGVQQGG
jgi:hypothetical protein